MLTTIRHLTHRALDSCRDRKVVAPALTFPPTRRALNAFYETVGRRTKFGDVFWRAVDENSVRSDFLWRTTIHGRTLLMPVDPAMARGSWHSALNWSWSGHRHMRLFYEYVLRTMKPGVFFDIGANYGTHSYPLALHGWRCLCFEPQTSCVDFIRRVAALNGFSGIERYCIALSDSEGTATFYTSPSTWISSFDQQHVERFEPATPTVVPLRTLDSVVGDVAPTLVKIDVEGWELHVLRGAEQTIRTHQPIVVVEVAGTATHRPELFDFFRQMHYSAIALMANGFQAVPFASNFIAHESENFAFLPHQLTSAAVRDCS